MSAGLSPEVQVLAEAVAKMRAALIRCGVSGPLVLQIPATNGGFDLATKLQMQPPHAMNDYQHRKAAEYGDRTLVGRLTGVTIRLYEPGDGA